MLFSCMVSSFKTAGFSLAPTNLITSVLEFSLGMFSLLKSADLLNVLTKA